MITFLAEGIMKVKVLRQEKAQPIPRAERSPGFWSTNWLTME